MTKPELLSVPLQAPQQLFLHGHHPGLRRGPAWPPGRQAPGRTCAVGAYGTGALRLFLPGKRLEAVDGTGGSGYALGVDQANINSGRI